MMDSKFGKRVHNGEIRVNGGSEDWHFVEVHKFVVAILDEAFIFIAVATLIAIAVLDVAVLAAFAALVVFTVLNVVVFVVIVISSLATTAAGSIVVGLATIIIVGFVMQEVGSSVNRVLTDRCKRDEFEGPLLSGELDLGSTSHLLGALENARHHMSNPSSSYTGQ
jgi:hypothetical protein